MICPICTHEMVKLTPGSFQCERDEVLLTSRISRSATRFALHTPDEATARRAEEGSKCPRHDLGVLPLDLDPNKIQLGDMLVHRLELRKVVNLQRVGTTGLARRVTFEDGRSFIAQKQQRVYRSAAPPPSTAARALARTPPRPR